MNTPKPDGPGKLIGGYATNNLSGKEKEQLFQAALEDQDLFNALMEDESLRDLLAQPGVRNELVEALTPQPSLWQRLSKWIATPVAWGSLGAMATAAILLVVFTNKPADQPRAVEMARSVPQSPSVQLPSAAEPNANPVTTGNAVPTTLEDSLKRKRVPASANEPPAPAPAAVSTTSPDATLKKEADIFQAAQSQSAPAQSQGAMAPSQTRAEQRLAAAPPPPAPRAESAPKPAPPPALAFDYAVTAAAVQMLPATDGFAALIARDSGGNYSRIVASARARKGFTASLPLPPGAAGETYQLVLTRDTALSPNAQPEQPSATLRALAPPRMARQAAAPAAGQPGAGGRPASSRDATADKSGPPAAQSGRAAADSPAATRVSVEITVPQR